ncbi:ATP-binding cassette domain-containing protein [Paenibacillus hodogayensis]|uniref:ATP-binding cassette domain-containing protein n=1 Tax=Paenibacillus hodogayensis TaxID=279208 RepID=A0ABV5VZ55_9BACL
MLIQVENLRKTYVTYERGHTFKETVASLFVRKQKQIPAVTGISFGIEAGEIVGFLGPNGAGKSTTLKILTGVLHPTSGAVSVMGYTPWRQRKHYVRHIGVVFGQKSQLLWDIPPIDAFYMNKAIYDIPDAEFEETLGRMIALLDVADVVRKPTRQLSLGERMKCEFAMAMLHRPQIVFLDEPTIGLDVIAKEKIRGFIAEMNKQGVTFILTTHDLDDVEQLAQRVIVINHGAIVFDDAIQRLRTMTGSSKMLRLTAKRPFGQSFPAGTRLVKRLSDYEAELAVDTATVELGQVIQQLSESFGIKDMSLEDPAIEHVIKELYVAQAGGGGT